ncbi:MFS transporter [Streptomyces sp. N2-109]|uniref:MFS transporter n=1 Tax=Streptomyces gossypii TaxID=2883101 RepID=A0ABT2JXA3_9ACTN|nr:MFS transporter [Streptomyces gossypii]MCT2592529.1 MFS transporter [Streptomyces gossypii]
MALFTASRHRAEQDPTGLGGRDFLLLMAATLGTFSNYAPLLAVASLWSAEGGSGHGGVGAATGVTMATTVAVQLVMGRLLRRFGLCRILASGALLLGLPTFAYVFSSSLAWVLAVSAVRGAGFGMVAVAGSALVAELVPARQRGRAVGWYGIAVGLPQVICLPLAVWCAESFGFTPVFLATGALSVLAAPLAAMMTGQRVEEPRPQAGLVAQGTVGRLRPLAGPWTVLIVSACALGGVTSFLPLAMEGPTAAPTALFVLSTAVIAGRWAAGVWSDRAGVGLLLVPGVLACALGTGGFALATSAVPGAALLAVASAAVYGLGFGALQNDTLVVMFRRAGPSGNGTASTAWNMAYDAGTGVGAVGVGLFSQALAVNGAYAVAAALIMVVVPFARRDGVRERADRCRRHPDTEVPSRQNPGSSPPPASPLQASPLQASPLPASSDRNGKARACPCSPGP